MALDQRNQRKRRILMWLGVALYEIGDRRGARAELETSERLEPAAPATESWLADVFFLDRQYDAAAEHLRRALEIDPNRSDALAQLGAVEVQRGAFSQALAADERFARSCKCGPYAELMNAYVYARMQRRELAQAALAHAERTMPRGKDESINVAFVYIALGQRARALAALQRARVWEHGKTAYLAADPRFDPVREDPRASGAGPGSELVGPGSLPDLATGSRTEERAGPNVKGRPIRTKQILQLLRCRSCERPTGCSVRLSREHRRSGDAGPT